MKAATSQWWCNVLKSVLPRPQRKNKHEDNSTPRHTDTTRFTEISIRVTQSNLRQIGQGVHEL